MQVPQILQDIVSNLKINFSLLSVTYSYLYKKETSFEIRTQIQKFSQEIQYQYLHFQLMEFIHSIYFEGSHLIEASQEANTNKQILKKIASLEIDWDFYEQLDKNNQGKGFFHPLFHIIREEADGSLAVDFDQFTLHIQREQHLSSAQQSATINDQIKLWLPSSYIYKNRYRANGDFIGNLPSEKEESTGAFIYFNFSPEVAVSAMKFITKKLNANQIPFVFEVLHNPLNYRRYESGILKFNCEDYEKNVFPILQTIYAKNKSHFQPQIPLFTKVIAPGIGLAEHPLPELKFRPQQDFGWNRCEIIANALLEALQNGDESPEARIKYVIQHFERMGIDLERPYLNPGSEDIYTPLDVSNNVIVNK